MRSKTKSLKGLAPREPRIFDNHESLRNSRRSCQQLGLYAIETVPERYGIGRLGRPYSSSGQQIEILVFFEGLLTAWTSTAHNHLGLVSVELRVSSCRGKSYKSSFGFEDRRQQRRLGRDENNISRMAQRRADFGFHVCSYLVSLVSFFLNDIDIDFHCSCIGSEWEQRSHVLTILGIYMCSRSLCIRKSKRKHNGVFSLPLTPIHRKPTY